MSSLSPSLHGAPASSANHSNPLIHGWENIWPPYKLGTPESPSGFDIDILSATCAEAGLALVHTRERHWSDLLLMNKLGRIDLSSGTSWSKERESYAWFIGPYRDEVVGIYVRKKDLSRFSLSRIEDLAEQPFKLGINQGFSYGGRLNELITTLGTKAIAVDDKVTKDISFLNRRKLMAGRIDGYVGYPIEQLVANSDLEFGDEIELLPSTLVSTGGVYFMLSKKNHDKATADRLQQALDRIMSNGVYEEILKGYDERYALKGMLNPL